MDHAGILEHIDLIRSLCKPGGALAIDAPTATINNLEWFFAGEPTPQRRDTQRRIRHDAISTTGHIDEGRRAILLAGPPGAGKSTVILCIKAQSD